MSLTRPKFAQVDTTFAAFSDPITILHQGATVANVDVGFLFNRANGLVSNVALYWNEETGRFITAYTSSSGNTNANVTATSFANIQSGNVFATGFFYANGTVFSSGSTFTGGYVQNTIIAAANLVANSGTASSSTTTGALVVAGGSGISGALNVGGTGNFAGNLTTGHILPSANITYDIGSPTLRFRTLYISGNTIDMGGAQITTDTTSGGFAFVPKPTSANPNPLGTVFSPSGGISTINTTGGVIAAGAINTSINNNQGTANFGNVKVNSEIAGTSTTTGALVVVGGAGIAGALYIANTGDVSANIGSLLANAGSQATSINTINANLGTATTNITTLFSNTAGQANQITGANAAIVTANSAVVSFIGTVNNNLSTAITANTNAANAAIITANSAVVSFVGMVNSNLSAAITANTNAANTAATTANTNMKSYVDTQDSAITTAWTSNAATQATSINTINANIGSFYQYANANLGTATTNITTLFSNAATQATSINTIDANLGSYQNTTNANLGTATTNITTLFSNAAGQANQITGANAAIVTANTALKGYVDTQISNLINGAPATLDTLNEIALALGNDANLSATLVTSIANVAAGQTAANVRITTVDANLGTATTNITTLFSNAAGQANQITGANAAIVTANSAVVSFIGTINNNLSTAITANTNAANAAIVTANTSLKSYVDTQDSAITTAWTANATTQATSINTINANLGSYQNTTNANIGTLFLGNASTQANLGAFEAYANTKIGTNTNSNLVVVATTTSTSSTTGALVVAGGVGVAGQLTVASNISLSESGGAGTRTILSSSGSGAIINHNDNSDVFLQTQGNTRIQILNGSGIVSFPYGITANSSGIRSTFANIITSNGVYWANGAAYSSGSGITYTASATTPVSPSAGNFWYDTAADVKYQYINDGTSSYWVDQSYPTSFGNLTVANTLTVNGSIIGTVTNTNYSLAANVAIYESVTATTTNATHYPMLSGITTGNTASFTASGLTFNPSTSALAVGGIATFSSNIVLPTAAGTCEIKAGTGDNATYSLYNTTIRSWWGIGFRDYTDSNIAKLVIDCRSGNVSSIGSMIAGTVVAGTINAGTIGNTGATLTGTLSTAAQTNITSVGTLTGLTMSGLITGRTGTGGVAAVSNDAGSLSVRGDATNAAVISFHRPGIYAINMGLDTDNVFKIGGWSATANVFQLTGAGVLTIASTINSNNLLLQGDGTNAYVRPSNSGSLYLGANNTNIALVNTTGILPVANVTYNLGSATAWWNLVYGKSVQAQYADLAEHYSADADYPPGTVVVFGGSAEITVSGISHDPRVAGVISTNPAYLMNAANAGLPVALTGRVPCQVQGPVAKGDRLVNIDTGVAGRLDTALHEYGCIIGKSLGEIADDSIQTIEIVVGRF